MLRPLNERIAGALLLDPMSKDDLIACLHAHRIDVAMELLRLARRGLVACSVSGPIRYYLTARGRAWAQKMMEEVA